MDKAGDEEKEREDEVDDDVHVTGVLLEEDGQRGDEDGQNDQKELLVIRHYDVFKNLSAVNTA